MTAAWKVVLTVVLLAVHLVPSRADAKGLSKVDLRAE